MLRDRALLAGASAGDGPSAGAVASIATGCNSGLETIFIKGARDWMAQDRIGRRRGPDNDLPDRL
jgi:hypothetical protein